MKPYENLQKTAETVATAMAGNGLNIEPIPGHNDLVLVRDGTPEAELRRKEAGTVVSEIEKGGNKFLICAH